MCGICGIVAKHQAFPIAMSVLSAMRDALAHRGPDDAGHYLTPGVGLGSRRLAIVDLSERGHMSKGENRYIFSGVYKTPHYRASKATFFVHRLYTFWVYPYISEPLTRQRLKLAWLEFPCRSALGCKCELHQSGLGNILRTGLPQSGEIP